VNALMRPVYTLNQVKKSYASRCVLDIAHLEVNHGEILAVVGPSGAGKSTLLRLLNFLEYPDSGSLVYQQHPAAPSLPIQIRRQVTTVFQHPALVDDNVQNNAAYGLKLRGLHYRDDEIANVLLRLGLNKLRKMPVQTLSAGERQRVALARAMLIHPDVLLLDEPTANLDPYNASLIETVIKEINLENKTTLILVTHNIFQARRLASRAGLMLNGQMLEISPVEQFFESPNDPRTRSFVNGEMIY